MADEQPNKEGEVTPKGAVEVDEEELDQAAGGIIPIGGGKPTDSFSLNFSKMQVVGQKVTPQNLAGAGPGAGPHVAPEKKI